MKQKSHSGAKKRIRLTGTGLVRVEKPCRNHLLLQKSSRQKALGRSPRALGKGMAKKVARLLPYS